MASVEFLSQNSPVKKTGGSVWRRSFGKDPRLLTLFLLENNTKTLKCIAGSFDEDVAMNTKIFGDQIQNKLPWSSNVESWK